MSIEEPQQRDDRGRRRRSRAEPDQTETVTAPAKVMRIGSMVKQLLEEVRTGSARRGQPRAAGRDLRALDRRAVRGAVARPAGRAAQPRPAVQGRRDPVRRRAAGRQGPAGRLAGGPVPRHPGDAVRPADRRPPAARADAPAAAGRDGRWPRRGTDAARRSHRCRRSAWHVPRRQTGVGIA